MNKLNLIACICVLTIGLPYKAIGYTYIPEVSIVSLVSNPKQYEGKAVQLIGYCKVEEGETCIYLTSELGKHRVHENGIWLNLNAKQAKGSESYNNQFVIVAGVFGTEDKGAWQMFAGSLSNITRLELSNP